MKVERSTYKCDNPSCIIAEMSKRNAVAIESERKTVYRCHICNHIVNIDWHE